MNSLKAEILIKWYLRLNGYFTVDNFIVHNTDNISKGTVANSTEVDVLGIRNKHSREIAGKLHIANDDALLNADECNLDFVIAEVKTGNEDRPNKIWRDGNIDAISYILRFAGFIDSEEEIQKISDILLSEGSFKRDNNTYSIRLIIFSEKGLNQNWNKIKNISLEHVVDFLLLVRGQCWLENEIGVASIHYQWDDLINSIFKIANMGPYNLVDKKNVIMKLLSS